MMFDILSPIIYTLSTLVALLFSVIVVKRVFESGIETYSSRILLTIVTLNTFSCCLILSGLGFVWLLKAFSRSQFLTIDVGMALLMFALPAKAVWYFFSCTDRIKRRFKLTPLNSQSLQRRVERLSMRMGIRSPRILTTQLANTPFVFGRTSRSACLVVPNRWEDCDDAVLTHELSHVRNGDAGFLTWAFSFLHQLWLIPVFLILLTICSVFVTTTTSIPAVRACVLYCCCLLNLWLLYTKVLRERESLADKTTALLVGPHNATGAIDNHLSAAVTGLDSVLSQGKLRAIFAELQNWLSDRALFGKKRAPWQMAYRLFRYVYMTHPTRSERIVAIRDGLKAGSNPSVKISDSFWAGTSIGLLAALIALGGLWFVRVVLGVEDTWKDVPVYSTLLLLTAPWAIVYVLTLFVIPMFASLAEVKLTKEYIKVLMIRYVVGVLGCCCTLVLVIIGGWPDHETMKLFLVASVSSIAILVVGFTANTLVPAGWGDVRYWSRPYLADLSDWLRVLGIALALFIAMPCIGLIFLCTNRMWLGANLIIATAIGFTSYSFLSGKSRVSIYDQYGVFFTGPFVYALDGKRFNSAASLICFSTSAMTYGVPAIIWLVISYVTTQKFGMAIPLLAWFLILAVVVGGVLLLLDWQSSKVIGTGKYHRIYILHNSLTTSGQTIPFAIRERIEALVETCDTVRTPKPHFRDNILTTQRIYELAGLSTKGLLPEWFGKAYEWILRCDLGKGFGLWPETKARLCSTYHSLAFLRQTGFPKVFQTDSHINWIKSFQCPTGPFQGPWSKRPTWEDTFFAVASLKILGSTLDSDGKQNCLCWAKDTLISEGIDKDRLDAFYHCLATIDALDALDDETANLADNWLSSKIDRLLLTNIAHNSENVHHAVLAHSILEKRGRSPIDSEQISLLADRINTALEAELTILHI